MEAGGVPLNIKKSIYNFIAKKGVTVYCNNEKFTYNKHKQYRYSLKGKNIDNIIIIATHRIDDNFIRINPKYKFSSELAKYQTIIHELVHSIFGAWGVYGAYCKLMRLLNAPPSEATYEDYFEEIICDGVADCILKIDINPKKYSWIIRKISIKIVPPV